MIRYNIQKFKDLIYKCGFSCRKVALTKTRRIDSHIISDYKGEVNTIEGKTRLLIGDHLATNVEESEFWVISQKSMLMNKKLVGKKNGWDLYKNTNSIKVVRMKDTFEVYVNGSAQIGNVDDYLAYNGYSFWIINNLVFSRDYIV